MPVLQCLMILLKQTNEPHCGQSSLFCHLSDDNPCEATVVKVQQVIIPSSSYDNAMHACLHRRSRTGQWPLCITC